jgi:hypothetical protein
MPMPCPAEVALTDDEVRALNALPGADFEADTEPLGCDFGPHGSDAQHTVCAQMQYAPGALVLWWLFWDDEGRRELRVAPGCGKGRRLRGVSAHRRTTPAPATSRSASLARSWQQSCGAWTRQLGETSPAPRPAGTAPAPSVHRASRWHPSPYRTPRFGVKRRERRFAPTKQQ